MQANQERECLIAFGRIVRRKADPVHSGRVIRASRSERTASVRWFGKPPGPQILECRIPWAALELAEDWK
jgi:hypothetical protein